MEKTKHENVCDRYRQALEQQFIQSDSPRPIMILAVKAKNDEIRYEAEDNDVDVVKDIKYCPFCDKNGNIATIHPKPDELHPPSNTGNWCPAFFTSLQLGSIKYKRVGTSSVDKEDIVSLNFVSAQKYDSARHQIVGFDYCPYCHSKVT